MGKTMATCAMVLLMVCMAQADDIREITGDGVRLRSGPSTETEILNAMDKGTRVGVLETLPDKPWAKVFLVETRQEGWVHTDYVSAPAPAPATEAMPEPAPILEPIDPVWPPAKAEDPRPAVRESASPGAPTFADVSHWDPAGWQILVPVPPGTPVRFLSEEQAHVYTGTARAQTVYENECAGGSYPSSQIELDPGQDTIADPILGIVGGGNLEPLSYEAVTDPGRIQWFTDLVGKNSDAKAAFAERGTPSSTTVYGVKAESVRAALVVYEYTNDLGGYVVSLRYFAFVAGNRVYFRYAGCPTLPEFFLLGDNVYSVFNFGDCESDDYNKMVLEISEDGIREVYHSNAFGC